MAIRKIVSRFPAALVAVCLLPATGGATETAAAGQPTTPATVTPAAKDNALPDAAVLFERIIEHYRPMYAKYRGIETKSHSETKIYDSETSTLEDTMTMLYVGREFFYEEREGEILEYTKNGEKLDPDEAQQGRSSDPMYPIWDSNGPKHYRIKVLKQTILRRKPCYALQIIPKDDTERHFQGTFFVHAETLDLVYMDGTMADLPFGVDSMSFKFYFKQQGDLAVVDHGSTAAAVDIPIIYPDVLYTSEMRTIEAKGIPK